MSSKRLARRGSFQITDAEKLGLLLRETIAQLYKTQREAAQALGITPRHWRRLSSGKAGQSITAAVTHSIKRLLPEYLVAELEELLVHPKAKEILTEYNRWLDRRMHQREWAQSITSDGRTFRFIGKGRPWAVIPILGELHRREPGKSRLAYFRTKAEELGWQEDSSRYVLALKRIAAPFIDAEDSSGVELTLSELSDRKLTTYLNRAIANELMFLRRARDQDRAERVRKAGPRTWST